MADRLNPNETLSEGHLLTSQDGRFRLVMQNDGNLVLYRSHDNHATWASGTAGQDTRRAIMQNDGNFVVYHTNGQAGWASGTQGNPGSFLLLQNDGNLVVYKPLAPIWASGTQQ
jgi:hypothetical protein